MSVNIEQVTRYFESKLYVLMHDPPDKAWLIINGINHVNRAKELYQRLFQGTPFGGGVPNLESDMRIIKSDKLASSFDRWIFLKPSRSNYVYKRIRLLNIFNPSYSYEIPHDYNSIINEVREYEQDLRHDVDVVNKLTDKDPRSLYNFFYAAYEAYWVMYGLPPSPADTRAPTHDVFDHAYASVMISNWVSSNGELIGGYYVIGDIPSVQQFISASRRAGDLWASSWVISMVIWLTIWPPLVWRFGPDILIRPTTRLNPLYYAFLAASLSLNSDERENSCKVFNKLVNVLNNYEKLSGELIDVLKRLMGAINVFLTGKPGSIDSALGLLKGIMQVAFIGEYFQLILPRRTPEGYELTKEEIINELKSSFSNALNCILDSAFKLLNNIGSNYDYVVELIKSLKSAGLVEFKLPLRIGVLSIGPNSSDDIKIGEVYCPLSDKTLVDLKISNNDCREMFLFDYLMTSDEVRRKIRDEEGRRLPTIGSWFDSNGSPRIDLTTYTSTNGWIPSTLNPEVPAVIKFGKIINSNRNICYNEEATAMLKKLSPSLGKAVGSNSIICAPSNDQALSTLMSVFKPGEALSSVDLAKRVIYLGLGALFSLGNEKARFESTEDVAVRYLFSISSLIKNIFSFEDCVQIFKYINSNPPRDIDNICPENICGNPEIIRNVTEECVEKALTNMDLVKDIYNIYNKLAQDSVIDDVCGSISDAELKNRCMANVVGRFLQFHFTYAIVRGDGDSVGDLHEGLIPGYLDELIKLYNSMLNDDKYVDGDLNEFRSDVEMQVKVLQEIKCSKYFTRPRDGSTAVRIPISPAYKFAITRSLMVTALKALYRAIGMNVMPIYMGGDDIAALAPIENTFSFINEIRKIYWGGLDKGSFFHRAGDYAVPALAVYGQSYSVRFTHILDIFSYEYAEAGKLLNDYAKESDWGSFKKDSMAISASRTSHISVLPVRPKGIVIRSIEDLKRLMSYVYSGLLSTGVPNDFDRFKDIYNKAKSMNKVDIMINVIKHVINNNTRLESVLNDLVARAECSLKEYEKHGGDYILNLINSVNILRRLP